jgi:hypothetical protein
MKITRAVAALLLVSCISVSANADPLGMTWTPGGYTATTFDVPHTPANGTIVSAITPTSLSATLTTNPANNVLGALFLDGNFSGGPLASQTLRLQYDVTVNHQPSSATLQPKNLNLSLLGGPASAGTAGIMLGMNIAATVPGPATPWAFRFAMAPTGATDGVFAMRSMDNTTLFAFGEYDVGTSYNVVLDANYTTGLLNAYINGNLALSGFQFAAGGPGVTTSEVFIHLNGELNHANSVTIGGFNAAVSVPDNGLSLAVLGGLFAVMGVLGHRFRKQPSTAA